MNDYSEKNKGKEPDKRQFAIDFAREVNNLGDKNILASIVSNAVLGYGIPGLSNPEAQCVCNETDGKNSCACTPVSKSPAIDLSKYIGPDEVRSLTEHLIAYAKKLSAEDKLSDIETQIS